MTFSLSLPRQICYPLARLAQRSAPARPAKDDDQAEYYDHQYRTTDHMRSRFFANLSVTGKVVLDVGSGLGGRAPYWMNQGAARVICIDVNRQELQAGQSILANKFPQFAGKIEYHHPDDLTEPNFADVAVMVDVFEHLVNPRQVLLQCHRWLRPGGQLWSGSIGWYNYMASHCLGHIPIPWCQVIFSQRAIIQTIRRIIHQPDYSPNVWERLEGLGRWDKVQTLKDRPGEPLNMLSLRQVRKIFRQSPFELTAFEIFGFSGRTNALARSVSSLAKIPMLREFFHSYYTAMLTKR
jgi:2-polyprenyl-3-methyl-5-hydroxy-6-metoxy-1,4-benzoquinol methylase